MNNRPYICDSSNVHNENLFHTVPTQFGQRNILVTHGQHKNIVDRATTSIEGQQQQPSQYYNYNMFNQPSFEPPAPLFGQRQPIPGGVTYTFNPMAQNYALRNFTDLSASNNQGINQFYQQPLSLQHQIAMNQLQKHALESMLLHEQFRENPFKLQFHKDGQTDTGDLSWKCPCDSSKSTVLAPLQSKDELRPTTPVQLFSDCVKRKQLRLKENQSPVQYEEKGIQNSPEIATAETQHESTTICECPKPRTYSSTDIQTETKKVTFDDPNPIPTNKAKKPHKGQPPHKRRSRHVDEDSSDSSGDTSQSSDENS